MAMNTTILPTCYEYNEHYRFYHYIYIVTNTADTVNILPNSTHMAMNTTDTINNLWFYPHKNTTYTVNTTHDPIPILL